MPEAPVPFRHGTTRHVRRIRAVARPPEGTRHTETPHALQGRAFQAGGIMTLLTLLKLLVNIARTVTSVVAVLYIAIACWIFTSGGDYALYALSLIHISEPTRQAEISYAVFCL